jgi:hypothetical protein
MNCLRRGVAKPLANASQVPTATSTSSPPLITAAGERALLRFLEFFVGTIRNPHTRRAGIPYGQNALASRSLA